MIYRLLADSVVAGHLLFVAFVVGGGFLVIWWPRLAWVHLPCALWGVAVEIGGWICPLTYLENTLRHMSQEAGYPTSFVEHYLLPLIYPDLWFPGGLPAWGFSVIGGGVLLLNLAIYTTIWQQNSSTPPKPNPSASDPTTPTEAHTHPTQRRDGIRVTESEQAGLILQVKQEDGTCFDATLLDLGLGGCSILLPDQEPPLTTATPLLLTFFWCLDKQLKQPATLLSIHTQETQQIGHIRFCAESHQTRREIGLLVAHIERLSLRARRNADFHGTEYVAEWYPTAKKKKKKRSCRCC